MLFSYAKVISQNTDAELFFNDGTSITGYGMISNTDKIKFRISLDDEPEIWTDLMVEKIVFYGFEMSVEFQYVKLKPNKYPRLLEVLVDEETKLFSDTNTYSFYQNNGVNDLISNGMPMSGGYSEYSTTKMYVQKAKDEFAFALTGNFRRKAKKYFSDCEALIKKINSGKFRKSTAKEMVYYYNDYCGE